MYNYDFSMLFVSTSVITVFLISIVILFIGNHYYTIFANKFKQTTPQYLTWWENLGAQLFLGKFMAWGIFVFFSSLLIITPILWHFVFNDYQLSDKQVDIIITIAISYFVGIIIKSFLHNINTVFICWLPLVTALTKTTLYKYYPHIFNDQLVQLSCLLFFLYMGWMLIIKFISCRIKATVLFITLLIIMLLLANGF